MSIIEKYKEFIKDNPEGYWFKRKIYGWGWTPVKWQGWAVIVAFVAFIIWSGESIDGVTNPTQSQLITFYVKIVAAAILVILIGYLKGEKPKWQWGPEDKK